MKLELSDLERRARDHHSIPLDSEEAVVEAFHRLSYDASRKGLTWHATRWKGYPVYKLPSDLWLYAELFSELRPRTVIETGTADGGSALYFADLLRMLQVRDYTIVTMDILPLNGRWPAHESIFYVPSWDSARGLPQMGRSFYGGRSGENMTVSFPPHLAPPVLVVLDSDHSEEHVARELDVYARLVTEGSYLVVEDSNVNGHPVLHEHGPGPQEALDRWLPDHPEFRDDRARPARQLFSYHTWLKRIGQQPSE